MEFASVQNLYLHLISSAIQRCRASEKLCRLSVILKCFPDSDPSVVRISISDTGLGSCLEEFQGLKYSGEGVGAEKWDGVLSVRTTIICENEIRHYQLNLKEGASDRRLTMQPSQLKNGVEFSGTEVHLLVSESIDVLLAEITSFLQKVLILKIPNITIEVVVECGDIPGSCNNIVFIANECSRLPFSATNLDRLKLGLEDYILKHGYSLKCESCFPSRESLKIGSGTVSCMKKHRNMELILEAVIVISEVADPANTCFKTCCPETKVFWFQDFAPTSISPACLKALTSINWKNYGLTLENTADQHNQAILKWEDLPPHTHIDIVLHCYQKHVMPSAVQRTRVGESLIRKAIRNALDDLKNKHAGVLLSSHALKICTYARDLARTISGLILSSNDSDFQGECFSLLGLESQQTDGKDVEENIEEKIVSVIEMNDLKPQGAKEIAPFLFEDNNPQELETADEIDQVSADDFCPLDMDF